MNRAAVFAAFFSPMVLVIVLACAACASGVDDPFVALARKCDAAPGASSCAAAGDYLWENRGNKLRPCMTAAAVACQRAGEDSATALRRIDKLALEYHDRACLFGEAAACNKAGLTFAIESSSATEENETAGLAAKAEERFRKACSLGDKDGCRNAGSTRPAR